MRIAQAPNSGTATTTQPATTTTSTSVRLVDPLGINEGGLPVLASNLNRSLLGLIGLVALIMFIYAGITLLTAAGDSSKVSQAKDTMLYAAIGLVVVFTSYAIVNFVISIFLAK